MQPLKAIYSMNCAVIARYFDPGAPGRPGGGLACRIHGERAGWQP
jgi:hypothetical protein